MLVNTEGMMTHGKRNSGRGHIVNDDKSKRSPERTLRNCGGWYEGRSERPIVTAVRGPHTDPDGGASGYFRKACVNFLQVSQWPAVLDFFGEMAYRPVRKSETDFSCVAAFPGDEAFGYSLAHWGKCRVVYAEWTDPSDMRETRVFRFRNAVGKDDRVLVAFGTLSDPSDAAEFSAAVTGMGGRIAGIVCAVNDTFPSVRELVLPGKRVVPIFSVVSTDIPRYRHDDPKVAAAVLAGDVIMDPYDPESWAELMASAGKRGRK